MNVSPREGSRLREGLRPNKKQRKEIRFELLMLSVLQNLRAPVQDSKTKRKHHGETRPSVWASEGSMQCPSFPDVLRPQKPSPQNTDEKWARLANIMAFDSMGKEGVKSVVSKPSGASQRLHKETAQEKTELERR